MNISAKELGLPTRTVLEQLDKNTIAIVINRKSRIIMKDGKKIAEKARIIQASRPGVTIVLKTTAPVCSKTIRYLEEEGIGIVSQSSG